MEGTVSRRGIWIVLLNELAEGEGEEQVSDASGEKTALGQGGLQSWTGSCAGRRACKVAYLLATLRGWVRRGVIVSCMRLKRSS